MNRICVIPVTLFFEPYVQFRLTAASPGASLHRSHSREETTMNNLFDIMMQAQNGQAVDNISRQFGLSREQTERAIELMMPAFSQGLKRNTADPMGLMNFMTALASGQHAKYHTDPQEAFRTDAISEGNAILGHLFGSKDTSRAVADQVALASGIGPAILKQMLPVIASMIMGGLFKSSSSRADPFSGGTVGPGGPGGIFGDVLGSIMESMMGGQPQGQPQAGGQGAQRTQNPMENNPFGKMFEDMMGNMMRGGMSQADGAATPDREPEAPASPPRGEDIFGEMFESGRKVQDQYKKNLDSIFDTYLDGMRKL